MSTYSIKRYQPAHKSAWDAFIAPAGRSGGSAKNTSFLFYRDFIEYHAHRFTDYSLLVYKKEELLAVLPANAEGKKMYSHQGLTHGGLILAKKIKFKAAFELFKELLVFLEKEGFKSLEIKNIPSFYNLYPAEELDYLCFLLNAETSRVDIAAVIDNKNPIPIQKNRLEGVKKAKKNTLEIEETTYFSVFWSDILVPNLAKTHNAAPVHSLKEITLLQKRFPKHIRQFNVLNAENKIVAGATIFESENVAHVQYISGNADKQQLGSLDFLFHHLITVVFKDKPYFDFGTSNENAGRNLNAGLQYWKECFGARTFIHRSFCIQIKNHYRLNEVLI